MSPLTGNLGGENSRLSNIELGLFPIRVIPGRIGQVINLKAHYQPNLPRRKT